ncbi:MAG: hypothetical protein ACT4RN_20220, partial [Pseudonocardia sp.]
LRSRPGQAPARALPGRAGADVDFRATVAVAARRWYLALPAFLLAVALAAWSYSAIPTRHVARASVVLTTPLAGSSFTPGAEAGEITNPLLNFSRGLSETVRILVQAVNAPGADERMGAVGGVTQVRANNGSENPENLINSPFLFVEGVAPTPQEARRLAAAAVELARTELAVAQNRLGAAPSTHITFTVFVEPMVAFEPDRDARRSVAAVLALGLIGALAVTYAGESVAVWWRRRREPPAVPGPPAPDGPAGAADRPVEVPTGFAAALALVLASRELAAQVTARRDDRAAEQAGSGREAGDRVG